MSNAFRAILIAVVLFAVFTHTVQDACAQNDGQRTFSETQNNSQRIEVVAAFQEIWKNGETTVTALRGGVDNQGVVRLRQGSTELSGESLVIIDSATTNGHQVQIYAEGRVVYSVDDHKKSLGSHRLQLHCVEPVDIRTTHTSTAESPSSLMKTALGREPQSKQKTAADTVSLQVGPDTFQPPQYDASQSSSLPEFRKIQIRPRSNTPLQFKSSISRDTVPEEEANEISGGVRVLVEGLDVPLNGLQIDPGVLDLSADRVIIWTSANDGQSLNNDGGTLEPSASSRIKIYLEGNILVRQGQNTVTATHAFYDATNDRALLLNAELRAFLPQTGGTFRVRAERLRQLSRDRFHAQNAWTTTSPYGKPGFRLQASDIYVEPGPVSPFTEMDPETGEPKHGKPTWVTSLNSQFIVGNTPTFWLPRLTAPAEDPNIPIRRAVVKHDRVFGLQVKTVWNLTKILGQPKQSGMQWDLLADYLSDRGPAIGVEGEYDFKNPYGRAHGNASIIYQYDSGSDNLGRDRRNLTPEDEHRGQVIWRHKQELDSDTTVFGEIGYLSDRNYRESFHERKHDTEKDAETLLGIRQDQGLWSGTFLGRTELNEFEASTDWLPKADLYGFSQPLFNGLAYWSSHSSVGYADLEPGAPPGSLADPFTPLGLPYYADSTGVVAMTRHQIDAPFMLGPINVNPFVMGEAAFWDEGLAAEDIDRYMISSGLQAHLTATKIMPFVRSELWNLNGLAHKADTYLEYRITDASRNLDEIAQYNEIDDNSTERFRSRYTTQIFPGVIPDEFDPRFYAVRNGAGLWVSAPYHELVDDQQTMRLRFRNRLQTKVGPVGQERIRDWMAWEMGATYFPDADQDNFGEDFGLLYGSYRWNVNDRTSLLTNGTFDLFENSQNVFSAGILSQRSTRGSLYLGYRQVEAKNYLDSQTLVASYSYQMSPKWISTGSVAYDIAESEARGSSLTFSRVGLDWVMHFGFGIDTSKDNVGLAFAIEPRFGPPSPTNLSYLLGLER